MRTFLSAKLIKYLILLGTFSCNILHITLVHFKHIFIGSTFKCSFTVLVSFQSILLAVKIAFHIILVFERVEDDISDWGEISLQPDATGDVM